MVEKGNSDINGSNPGYVSRGPAVRCEGDVAHAKRAILSGQLFRPQCELTQPDPDILCEYNVAVPIADGIVLTANVFRSRKAQAAGCAFPL